MSVFTVVLLLLLYLKDVYTSYTSSTTAGVHIQKGRILTTLSLTQHLICKRQTDLGLLVN